jgi:hypothetical protein
MKTGWTLICFRIVSGSFRPGRRSAVILCDQRQPRLVVVGGVGEVAELQHGRLIFASDKNTRTPTLPPDPAVESLCLLV